MVLDLGVAERGWRRLWVPEYFCQRVVAALVRPGLELRAYPDHPLRDAPELPDARRGDAILVMNYYGLRRAFAAARRDGVDIIEDHSHDPTSAWAAASSADFCIASLRKTIPISDGGVLWSPGNCALPPPPLLTAQRRRTAATKLSAMILKAMYLEGRPVGKATFRALAQRGERGLAVPAVSSMSEVARATLGSFPISAWRWARAENHAALRSILGRVPWLRVLEPEGVVVPFACVLVVESADRREHVRRLLIDNAVFATVHWPLERTVLPVGDEARELSRRMLTIHCDGRYAPRDMVRIGEIIAAMNGA